MHEEGFVADREGKNAKTPESAIFRAFSIWQTGKSIIKNLSKYHSFYYVKTIIHNLK